MIDAYVMPISLDLIVRALLTSEGIRQELAELTMDYVCLERSPKSTN